MTTDLPPRVQAKASEAGFGPLAAGFLHPNGRIYAIIYGGWAFMLIVYPLVLVVGSFKAGALPAAAVMIGLGVFLANQAVGSVTRRAFYLYPQGYIATGASGRVIRVTSWQDVSEIEGAGPTLKLQVRASLFGKLRNVCQIHHHKGRPIKFTEIADKAELAPLAYRLHAEAVQSPH